MLCKSHFASSCNKCTACGNWGHRNKSSRFCTHSSQRRALPNTKDSKCNKTEDDDTNYAFDQLCTSSACTENKPPVPSKLRQKKPLEHHVFDGQWIARSSTHPTMIVQLTPRPEDHATLSFPMTDKSKLSPITIPMIVDSGCSIMPLCSAQSMGFGKADIIPVKVVMRGAIREDLGVTGAIITDVSTTDTLRTLRSTRQFIYVSDKIEKAFLCQEALVTLGGLPVNFPQVPAPQPRDFVSAMEAPLSSPCPCPKRGQNPPPIPSELPLGLKATKENLPDIKEWLLDYYSATAFNTCEHQPLPMMTCEPLRLFVDPNAKPVAVHKPALVTIHWREKVYQDLERDVRLGILEKVHRNTPVT